MESQQDEIVNKQPFSPDQVGESDVLYGRGGATNKHQGNIYFRNLILSYQPQYRQARRTVKPKIAERIVETIRSRGGRFLKHNNSNDTLVEVGDEMAIAKTLQALRDTVPNPNHDVDKASPGRRKSPKQKVNAAARSSEEQVRIMTPPNHILVPRYPHDNDHAPQFYQRTNDRGAGFPHSDTGRQYNYGQHHDARAPALIPPPGFQQMRPSMVPYPNEPSNLSLSSYMARPILDSTSNVRFQQQPMSNQGQMQLQLPYPNVSQQNPSLSQDSISTNLGYPPQMMTNQSPRHAHTSPHSTSGPSSLHTAPFLDSSYTMQPAPRIQQQYNTRISPYTSATHPTILGPNSLFRKYLDPTANNRLPPDYQQPFMTHPRGPPTYPYTSTLGQSFGGNATEDYHRNSLIHAKDDYHRNSLMDRCYPSHPPQFNNIHSDARTNMQPFSHHGQPQPMHNAQGLDRPPVPERHIQDAFLPPHDSSSANAQYVQIKYEQGPERNVNPKPCQENNEKYVPV